MDEATASQRGGPERVEHTFKVVRWTCNVAGHRHRSQKSAATCMERLKGEIGELKKLRRNLGIFDHVRKGVPLSKIGLTFSCTGTNVMKAVNSMLSRARTLTSRCPYPSRRWTTSMLLDHKYKAELAWLIKALQEHEVQLTKIVEG